MGDLHAVIGPWLLLYYVMPRRAVSWPKTERWPQHQRKPQNLIFDSFKNYVTLGSLSNEIIQAKNECKPQCDQIRLRSAATHATGTSNPAALRVTRLFSEH